MWNVREGWYGIQQELGNLSDREGIICAGLLFQAAVVSARVTRAWVALPLT